MVFAPYQHQTFLAWMTGMNSNPIETYARRLVGGYLTRHDWLDGMPSFCRVLRTVSPDSLINDHLTRQQAQLVLLRAEQILHDMADLDPLTIAQRYFDLLPRQADHPLTQAVMQSLSHGPSVLELLRRCGVQVELCKDQDGENFLILPALDDCSALGDGLKQAMGAALSAARAVGPAPAGGLYSIH